MGKYTQLLQHYDPRSSCSSPNSTA